MSSKSSEQTPALESCSTTTPRDAGGAARIRAEVARGKKITARLEEIEPAAKESSASKKLSNTPTTLSSVNVFYYASPFDKAFLGTVHDSSKLAHFSLIARDQLKEVDMCSSSTANTSGELEVTLGRLDREAGLLVLKYINDSDIRRPKPLTYDLLPANSTLAFRCRVHHACNTLRVPHQLCGQVFRDRLCFDIRQLPIVTCADFQLVCETVAHDAGLMNVMQNKVAHHTLRGWITEHDLACIWEYVNKCDAQRGSNYVERIGAIFEKLQAEATARGKVYESGWCAKGVAPLAQQGSADGAEVVSARPGNMTVGAAEKALVVSIDTATRDQASRQNAASPAVVNPTGSKNMTVATAEKAALISTQATAGDHGAHLHSPQSNQFDDSEITLIRLSTAGPLLDLSSLPKPTPSTFTSKARTIPKLTLETNNPALSTSGNKINWTATEINTTTPPKKAFGNIGRVVGAIKPAFGLSSGKSKSKEKVAVPEKKKEQDGDKDGDSKEGKGKENITPTESVASGSSSTPGRMSYAEMLGSRP